MLHLSCCNATITRTDHRREQEDEDEEQEEADMFEYLPTARRLLATISTKLVCPKCGNSREKLEEFRDLSVDFPSQENHDGVYAFFHLSL